MSLSISSSQKHYARFGRCENVKTGETRCAMTPEDCEPARNDDGERWFSDLRLKQKGIEGAPCTCENTLMGACVTVGGKHMTYDCAPRTARVEEDYCRKEESSPFDPTYEVLPTNSAGTNCHCDALQSIEDDAIRHSTSSRTRYGACYVPNASGEENRFFCAYSSDYCTGDHIWLHPNDVPGVRGDGEHCTCESTHIGGCVGGMYAFHCALAEEDCHWNTFVLPIPLKTELNHACFLCEKTIALDPKPDEIDTTDFAPSRLNTATAVSIVLTVSVVSIVLFGVARAFGFMRRRNMSVQKEQTECNEETPKEDDCEVASEEGRFDNGEDSVPPENIPGIS